MCLSQDGVDNREVAADFLGLSGMEYSGMECWNVCVCVGGGGGGGGGVCRLHGYCRLQAKIGTCIIVYLQC